LSTHRDDAQPGDSQRGDADTRPVLTNDHRMLLEIRDTLYDGCWDVFARDLEARRRAQPHVFETVPESPDLLATIAAHLRLIAEMQAWERTHGVTLRADGCAARDQESG
jgi:hypothetical protein